MLDIKRLQSWLKKHGEPAYRAQQVNQAFFERGIVSFSQIKSWPASLKAAAEKDFSLLSLNLIEKCGTEKITRKFLLRTEDQKYTETVLIPMREYQTVCLSTQIGCPLQCVFCQSGKIPFTRNLTLEEIVDQYQIAFNQNEGKPSRVVFMGIGEPLLNLPAVIAAVGVLHDPKRWGISKRNITISTVGIKGKIRELSRAPVVPRLTVSLHAPNQKLREQLIPAAKKLPLPELLKEVREYERVSKHQTSYEYILLPGINDRPDHARELVKLLDNPLAHINLIPYNPTDAASRHIGRPDIQFIEIVKKNFQRVTIRQSGGAEIGAACGQLAGKVV